MNTGKKKLNEIYLKFFCDNICHKVAGSLGSIRARIACRNVDSMLDVYLLIFPLDKLTLLQRCCQHNLQNKIPGVNKF